MHDASAIRPRRPMRGSLRTISLFAAAGLALLATAACERSATTSFTGPVRAEADGTGSISGIVVDLDGKPVAGAVVTTPDGSSAVTGPDGRFTIKGLKATDRLPVTVSAPGFAPTTRIYQVVPGQELSREITVIPEGEPVPVVAGEGGVVEFGDGGSVEIPADAFAGVGPDEVVNVRVAYYDPADPERFRAAPGDFRAVEKDGSESVLGSNGMINVSVTSEQGERLQLAEGQRLVANLPDRAGSDNPWAVYRFDTNAGVWRWIAPATAGPNGTQRLIIVFIDWTYNIDWWWFWSDIRIQVLDRAGNPAPNVSTTGAGLSYFGGAEGWTDADGFATLRIGANEQVSVQAGSASATITTPPPGASGELTTLVF